MTTSGLATRLRYQAGWVDEPPFGAPVFEQLLGVADRLIVDTMCFDDPTFSLTRLAALIRANADRVAVSDLNWARLTPWQENLAQLFDSIDTLPYLERLERVSVRYARLPETGRVDPEQAFLLVGWLLSRLGWKMPPALPPWPWLGPSPPWPFRPGIQLLFLLLPSPRVFTAFDRRRLRASMASLLAGDDGYRPKAREGGHQIGQKKKGHFVSPFLVLAR